MLRCCAGASVTSRPPMKMRPPSAVQPGHWQDVSATKPIFDVTKVMFSRRTMKAVDDVSSALAADKLEIFAIVGEPAPASRPSPR